MTTDDIIRMARESEWLSKYDSSTGFSAEVAIRFAELVAAHEREECAKVCDDEADDGTEGEWDSCCRNLARQIRARGEK